MLKDEIDKLRSQLNNKRHDSTSTSEDLSLISEEILQREELMREKDKTWVQKLEESKKINEELQNNLKKEMEILTNNHKLELENLKNAELERMKKQEDDLIKKQKEFETEQIIGTATSLNKYYEDKLNSVKLEYENKIKQDLDAYKLEHDSEVEKYKLQILELNNKIDYYKQQSLTQIKQIQSLNSKIKSLELNNNLKS
jgi:hypothetical protein